MSVSIVIPTYNRKIFETLLEHNINSQTYYNIKEIIILDDSDKDRPLCIRTLIPIRYYTVPRCTIGMKRNMGVKLAHGEYIAFMDDDDFYHPDYIAHSIFEMEYNNKSIAGSADMYMYNKEHKWFKQRCFFIHYLNEATMVFKKSAWTGFGDTNSNEAVPFLEKNIGNIIETKIENLMCCVAHDNNTISKRAWFSDIYKAEPLPQYSKHIEILSSLNI
jgi:glycosyltransferase involved in cell wall biosynthesis